MPGKHAFPIRHEIVQEFPGELSELAPATFARRWSAFQFPSDPDFRDFAGRLGGIIRDPIHQALPALREPVKAKQDSFACFQFSFF